MVPVGSYGYMNVQNANENSLLDFNREKDASYSEATTNLPLTNFTYDVYSISGQGVAGAFRPYRSEVGHVYDRKTKSNGLSGNFSFEAGGGGLADLGTDVKVNKSSSSSGDWSQHNPAASIFKFRGSQGNDLYEPYYFRQSGEMLVDNDALLFQKMGGYRSVFIPLDKSFGWNVKTKKQLSHKTSGGYITHNSDLTKFQRDKRLGRNQLISTLNKVEAEQYGISKYINPVAEDHHVAEITVTQNDGARYVYGVAAYNTYQTDVTFAIANGDKPVPAQCSTGLVAYDPVNDPKSKNGNGRDEFYSRSTLPDYAHSYLLTEVLSTDFVDIDGDGPDDDDFGSYTKFSYDKIANYDWRVPYQTNQANHNEGLKSDFSDDKASYVYGKKDLFYLNKIETRTHVAVFHTSDRNDAIEAAGEHGGQGSDRMQKLDKISLYAKGDWNENYDPTNPGNFSALTPIKEVHFVYAYELCEGIPNGTVDGKLTLKQVYFTYQGSYKAKYNNYSFEYNGLNPSYNLKGYDIWGNYKPNTSSAECYKESAELSNPEFPYVEQDQLVADQNSSAWCLTDIILPSGGKISIDYESDDYAYVQDMEALSMAKIVGVGNSDAYGTSSSLFSGSANNNYLYFELDDALKQTNSSDVKEAYWPNNQKKADGKPLMYFRFMLDLDDKGLNHEFVSGYAKIEEIGICTGNTDYGFVRISEAKLKDNGSGDNVQAISKAGWNFTRMNLPNIAFGIPNNFPNPEESSSGIKNVVKTIAQASILKQTIDFFRGPNRKMRGKGFCSHFISNKSWVRLRHPNNAKLGGGCRVKRIEISDEWSTMVGAANGDDYNYGQEYTYQLENGKSSGVASYEPMQSHENPLVQPIFMTTRHLLAPNDEQYIETPFGESFFPSPGVTYSRVTVKNLQRLDGLGERIVKRNATGSVVHEFYTTYDFPTKVRMEQLHPVRKSLFSKFTLVKGFTKDYMTASQGYTIINNDMNGKPKAQWVYGEEKDDPISGVQYLYTVNSTEQNYDDGDPFTNTDVFTRAGELDNTCTVIGRDGSISSRALGVEYDVITDFREQQTVDVSAGANAGLSAFLAGIIPGIVPSVWPSYTYSHVRFRSAVVTKVINQHGIIREVVAHDLGASVSTKNLAWDSETGEVLLTSTQNEYGDNTFTLNYPAHWAYDRMGQAYQNTGATLDITVNPSGQIVGGDIGDFVNGDEVYIGDAENGVKRWVLVDATGDKFIIDENGDVHPGSGNPTHATVLRSGRRNQQALAIGSITLKNNPLEDNSFDNIYEYIENNNAANRVLAAQAMEFDDNWRTYASVGEDAGNTECNCDLDELAFDFQIVINHILETHLSDLITMHPNHSINIAGYPQWSAMSGDVSANPADHIVTAWFSDANTWIWAFGPDPNHPLCSLTITNPGLYNDLQNALDISIRLVEADLSACNEDVISIEIEYVDQSSQNNFVTATLTKSCWSVFDCNVISVQSMYACASTVGDTINPFIMGIQGIFRPKRSYLYLGERDQQNNLVYATNSNQPLDLRNDGQYTNFTPFWVKNGSNGVTKDETDWTWASQVTNYTPFGQEVENQDALYRFSGATFGYNHSYAIAVANNARMNQIGFDGFEDYDFFKNQDNCIEQRHFAFDDYADSISENYSHTGRRSMKISPSANCNMVRPLSTVAYDETPCHQQTGKADDAPYTLKDCDVLLSFGPTTVFNSYEREYSMSSVKYVFSYWVRALPSGSGPVYDYTTCSPEINIGGSNILGVPFNKSAIIDGWQKVEYYFSIPNNQTGSIEVKFNNTGTTNIYVDDIRIHPFNSNIKTFVYDPISLRLMAELDNNNYATFYEYDEEGILLRIKRETERGIVTIQESRNSTVKND